jgi:protease I
MKKVLFVVAPELFRDEEFLVPYEYLKSKGIDCTIASTKTGMTTGKLGAKVTAHQKIDEVAADFYDAISITGGPGSKTFLWNNKDLVELVQNFQKQNKITAAICSAACILAQAGIMKGKKSSSFPGDQEKEFIKLGGATFVEAPVTVDGNTITADGPASAQKYAEEIYKKLS